jgi:hypothetical protein
LSWIREDRGADRPGSGNTRKAVTARAIGRRKLFFIYSSSTVGFPAFPRVMQGISALATAPL